MLRSMTGYGKHEAIIKGKNILVEIKSVNSRYFEFVSKITRGYSFLEYDIKKFINKKILRGKVDVFVSIQTLENDDTEVLINHSLAEAYIKALQSLKDEYSLKDDLSVSTISKYSDIFTVKSSNNNEDEILEDVLSVVKISLDKLMSMREKEGENLKEDIKLNFEKIEKILAIIEEKSPVIISNYEKRLMSRISELVADYNIDEERVVAEVAIFADKIDINEEIIRIRSHLKQLELMIESDKSVGRKMDFIVQEMNREINTIGSKSPDLDVSHMVVEIKSCIEKIREQVQNIE